MTLREFHNSLSNGITYLWVCGVGCPGGQSYTQNTETEISEDYLDIQDMISCNGLGDCDVIWELEGEVENGQWIWNGKGVPRGPHGNSYYQIQAS